MSVNTRLQSFLFTLLINNFLQLACPVKWLWLVASFEWADECSPSLMTARNLAAPSTRCSSLPAFPPPGGCLSDNQGHCYWRISKKIILLIIQRSLIGRWSKPQLSALSSPILQECSCYTKSVGFFLLQHLISLQPLKEGFGSSRCALFVRNGSFLPFSQGYVQ